MQEDGFDCRIFHGNLAIMVITLYSMIQSGNYWYNLIDFICVNATKNNLSFIRHILNKSLTSLHCQPRKAGNHSSMTEKLLTGA